MAPIIIRLPVPELEAILIGSVDCWYLNGWNEVWTLT